ncbi:Pentatricopeptide repeat [Dillenia turbinata]|uniref:Pentatricopeptide repeat n=1 Tax=Dillenia turbinata TaxID=194707 RepID=A0AAN8YZV7_9MAGN
MIAKLISSKQSTLLLHHLKPPEPSLNPKLFPLYFSSQPNQSTTPFAEALQILKTQEDNWDSNELKTLLFSPSSPPLSSNRLYNITYQLGSSQKALKFFQWMKNEDSSIDSDSHSFTFQAIFELANEETGTQNRLFELFEASEAHGIPLTASSANLLIKSFGRAKMVEQALLVYHKMTPCKKNTQIRNFLIDVLLRVGRVDDALNVLDEMFVENSKFPPDESTVRIVFGAFLRRDFVGRGVGDEELIRLVSKFSKMGLFPDAIRLSQLITRLCRNGKSGKAWDVLHDTMKLGGSIDAPPCNALLTGLGRSQDFRRMNLLLAEMKDMGVQPSVITFGILVNHLCKFRRVDEALQVLRKMNEEVEGFSVKPDVVIYNTVIDGLCKVGRQDEGLELVEQMRLLHGFEPSAETFNCLIDGFCKAGEIARSHELLDQMVKAGVQPNVVTLNTMVDGMCRHGRISSAIQFFNEMQEKGLKGNAITYTALINAFCNVSNIDKAMELYDEMLKAKCSPDKIVYYILISGLTQAGSKNGDFTTAREVMEQMLGEELVPNVVTYGALINAYCVNGDIDTAMKIFKRMNSLSKVAPNAVIYTILIDRLCKKNRVEDALSLMENMKSKKVRPRTNTYNAIFRGLQESNNLEKAFEMMDRMIKDACRPDYITMEILTEWLSVVGQKEKLRKFLEGYSKENNLLGRFARSKSIWGVSKRLTILGSDDVKSLQNSDSPIRRRVESSRQVDSLAKHALPVLLPRSISLTF